MDFAKLHNNFTELIDNLDRLVIKSAMELKSSLADLNVKQLEQGKGSDDANLEPEYASSSYAKLKKAWGSQAPTGTPDLKVTGAFHSGIEAIDKGKAIVMWSKDSKTAKLDKKYPKALGLNKASKTELKPDLIEKMVKEARKTLHKE